MLAPRVLIRTLGLRKMIYSRCSCPPKWRVKYLRLKFSCDGFHPPAFQKWCERMGIFWTPTLGKNSHWSPGCEISNKCVRRNHKVNTTSCLVINSPRQKGPVRFGMRFLCFLLAFFWPLSLKLAWNMIRFFRLGLKGPKPSKGQFKPWFFVFNGENLEVFQDSKLMPSSQSSLLLQVATIAGAWSDLESRFI